MIPGSLLGKLRQVPVKELVVRLVSGEAGHWSLEASLLCGTWHCPLWGLGEDGFRHPYRISGSVLGSGLLRYSPR